MNTDFGLNPHFISEGDKGINDPVKICGNNLREKQKKISGTEQFG